MKFWIVVLACIGIGYIAEIYYQNPTDYIVWVVISFMAFVAYGFLTFFTPLAFSLPVSAALIGFTSIIDLINGKPMFVLFGIFGSMAIIALFQDRFSTWRWSDWSQIVKG